MLTRALAAALSIVAAASGNGSVLQRPTVEPEFFNPSIGQRATLTFTLTEGAAVTVRVLDRDGVPVRTLAERQTFAPGVQRLEWNGRNAEGSVVPNEAWSFRIDVDAKGKQETYFPAETSAAMYQVKDVTYDRRGALFRYTLPAPSRVHLQAGVATTDPKTKVTNGPVLKTVVNREPRASGAVLEQWNGRDESGTIAVSELPNFVVAVAATPLPENSVITTGSRGLSFIEGLSARKGTSLLKPHHHGATHAHHQGLTSAEDVAPRLDLSVSRKVNRGATIRCAVAGPTARDFAKQGGEVMLFVDGRLVQRKPANASSFEFSVDAKDLKGRSHIVAVNWVTPNGPTAANAVRIQTAAQTAFR